MKVSVAIPVRNEEATIARLLDALLSQSHPADEIVLADGGSTDRTVEVARRYRDRGVRVLEIGPAYPGRGRNAAIRNCRNDWIALTDAGCIADVDWLAHLTRTAATLSAAGIVIGDFRPILTSEWEVAQALAFVGFDAATGLRPYSTSSALVHRRAWETVGGFPEHLRAAEDRLFWRDAGRAGIPIVRSPAALVRWRLARGPRAVFRRLRLYSAHHLAAGLARTWHHRVIVFDGLAAALLAAAAVWPPALVLLATGLATRVLRIVARQRRNIDDAHAFRVDRVLRVAWLLVIADAATWAGALDYARGREPRR